jgi:hypothetical protein
MVVVMMMTMIPMIVKIRFVIIVALKLDRVARTIKLNKVIVVPVKHITLMHITRALFKVAYHQGAEVILHVKIKRLALPSFFYFYAFLISTN